MKGQITFAAYLQSKKKIFPSCSDCVCRNCLFWWSSRCPYGNCFDDHRAKENPYDAAHPDEPPRTAWSDWKKPGEQAHWCRGAAFYPVGYCEHFVKYQGLQVQDCLKAVVSVFQDGYISCSMLECYGCERCYKEFEEKQNDGL